jgi:hypothetical protein
MKVLSFSFVPYKNMSRGMQNPKWLRVATEKPNRLQFLPWYHARLPNGPRSLPSSSDVKLTQCHYIRYEYLFHLLEEYADLSILTGVSYDSFSFWAVRLFFGTRMPSICCTRCFHYDPDSILLAFRLKMISSSLLLVFLIWSFLVQPATLLKNFISVVSIFASYLLLLLLLLLLL